MKYEFETTTEEGMFKLSEFLMGLEQEIISGRYRGPVKVEVDLSKTQATDEHD